MPVGKSGRIVIEIDPEIKYHLYQSLGKDGSSLKQWFLENVDQYLSGKGQLQLDLSHSQEDAKEGGRHEV